jgi:hypothetical protein
MGKKIFISYSNDDKNKMRSLEKAIDKTQYLSAIIIADKRSSMKLLTEKVSEGINECDYFIPILTRSSITSQWVNQEIGFAKAFQREMIPIIEQQILNDLKGFIHKQSDLPYQFSGNELKPRSEAASFSRTARIIANDLLIGNNQKPISDLTLENLFPGKWKCSFIWDGRQRSELFEIKDSNYIKQGIPCFKIDSLSVDLISKNLNFRKIGLNGNSRIILNKLQIIELGKQYEGFESDQNIEKISIKYERVE